MATLTSLPLAESDQQFLDKAIAGQHGHPGALLGILEKAQEHEPRKFLSREALEYIAAKTDTPLARITAWSRFTPSSTSSPREKIPSASAAGRLATPAARAIFWRA